LFLIEKLNSMHPFEIVFRIMLFMVGLGLSGAAIWIAAGNLYVIATYEHARAEITRCESIGPVSSKGLNSYGVQVRFQRNGALRTSSMKDATTKYEVGEVIDIYYKPETAYTVIGGDFVQMWFHCVFVGAAGLVTLFFALRPIKPELES